MSHRGTPFIPPLPTPHGSPNPPHPPVIPSPGGTNTLPPWGQVGVHPGAYPAYPTTPYTGPGYIPNLPPVTPQHPQHSAQQPQVDANGFSTDYIGFPNLGPPRFSPMAGPSAPLYPHTPYGPASAPPGGGWGGPPRAPYQYYGPPPQQQQQPPHTAYAGYGGYIPQTGAWGTMPQLPPQMTPGFGMPMTLDPWGQPPPGPTWTQQAQAQQAHAHAQAMYSQPPAPHMNLPQRLLGRSNMRYVGDRMDPFIAGTSYGPALEPFLVRVVGAQVKLNPLVEPLPENGGDRPHLIWNMLFQSSNCQRSTDPGHVSWANGRDEPATFPRVTAVNIVSETVPWMMRVQARNPAVGVTCGELIDGLSDEFHKLTTQADYEALSTQRRRAIGEAYRHNRSRSIGVPGGRLGDGLRRLDFLGKDTMFGGISSAERTVRRLIGELLPCTFVLRCVRQHMLTEEEHRDQEAREASHQAEENDRRRATVETAPDTNEETE